MTHPNATLLAKSQLTRGRTNWAKAHPYKTKEQCSTYLYCQPRDEGLEFEIDPQSMEELESFLNAIANRELKEEGVVLSYPAEWDAIPYPHKFMASILYTFDGNGSPN